MVILLCTVAIYLYAGPCKNTAQSDKYGPMTRAEVLILEFSVQYEFKGIKVLGFPQGLGGPVVSMYTIVGEPVSRDR